MKRLIKDHDLIPLKRDIENINSITSTSPLTFEYIDYLEKQNIEFAFKQLHFHQPTYFTKEKKKDFINTIKQKKHGQLCFKDNEYSQLTAECFLDTFIGKDFNEIDKFFQHINFKEEVCEFYRTFGLIALNRHEKTLYFELIKPFNFNTKYDIGLILYRSNIPYLIKHQNELFKDYDLNHLCQEWFKKVNSFETFNVNKYQNQNKVGNIFHSKSQAFTLKLSGLIIFKQDKQTIEHLINEYKDSLSQRTVFEFFRDNKCNELNYAFHLYRKHVDQYKSAEVLLTELDLLQKNLTVEIPSIMQKHLLNYDKCSQFLKAIGSFFKSEEDFKYSLISFNDEDKKCTISLSSTKQDFLKNGQVFFSKVINDKDIFMSPEKYKAVFYHTHFNNKFAVKNIKTPTVKI